MPPPMVSAVVFPSFLQASYASVHCVLAVQVANKDFEWSSNVPVTLLLQHSHSSKQTSKEGCFEVLEVKGDPDVLTSILMSL